LIEIDHKVKLCTTLATEIEHPDPQAIGRRATFPSPWIENFLQTLVRDRNRPQSTVRASPMAYSTLFCDWSTDSGVNTVGTGGKWCANQEWSTNNPQWSENLHWSDSLHAKY